MNDGKQRLLDQLRRRGICDEAVLRAIAEVPRETFVGLSLAEFAYDDSPLPIEEGQTISQPYIVALMTQAMRPGADDVVLEVGTGSGYAAAILSRIVKQVYSVERHQSLARIATTRLRELGYDNVEVLCGDGSRGWVEHAPYDAISVTAAAPRIPPSLLEQLKPDGRLVIPAGESQDVQKLLRITRTGSETSTTEELCGVRFVPLLGEEGWQESRGSAVKARVVPQEDPAQDTTRKRDSPAPAFPADPSSAAIAREAIPFSSIDEARLDGLLDRVGDCRLVLLGEATHGTAEFYDMRARISQELISRKGFRLLAVEADWPDAARIDHFIRDSGAQLTDGTTFSRFPTWMWANRQVMTFVQWLRKHNRLLSGDAEKVGFFGLDLYSLYASMSAVIAYLDTVDTDAAAMARRHYDCLRPWAEDPATYGRMALSGKLHSCEQAVVDMLSLLMQKKPDYTSQDGRRFLDASANARLVRNAENYYRVMYQGSVSSWNLRDQHMFDTLEQLLEFHGSDSKAIVWAHNSHLGNADATEMGLRGEHNIGSLCRRRYGDAAYLVGFGTDHGTVAAAANWGDPVEIMSVRSSLDGSYERLCHNSGVGNFLLPLRTGSKELKEYLKLPLLERAIGVIYRPETERASHYFTASLPEQFDEYIWFDETVALDPIGPEAGEGLPDTFPFGV